MKLLKKIVFIVIGLIALIAIGLYSFLMVRESRSKNSLVHRESEYVMKIAVDNILTDIAWNAILNPGYYSGTDSTQRVKDGLGKRTDWGVSIPASVYLFSLKSDTNVWYAWLTVEDQSKLHLFANDLLGKESADIEEENALWWIRGNDDKVVLLGDSKNVLVALSTDKTDKKEQMLRIWTEQATAMTAINTLTDFKFENSNDVQWMQRGKKVVGSLSFAKGVIRGDLSVSNSLLRLPKEAKVRELPASNVLNIYCQADIRPLLEKYRASLLRYNVPVDTLNNYYGGYLDLQWRTGEVLQTDSIIAYDYDENFNPIEKAELREEQVPNIVFTCIASPHLAGYLPEKMFYKFNKVIQGNQISLSTASNVKNEYAYLSSDRAFLFSYVRHDDAKRYLGWIPQLDKIEKMEISGRGTGSSNRFDMEVELNEKSIHALYQFFN